MQLKNFFCSPYVVTLDENPRDWHWFPKEGFELLSETGVH
jgi:hypothetical protein